MWIKLISPRVTLRPMDSEFKRHMAPPLALLVLGALTPKDHTVTIEDENVEPLTMDDAPDLVGITVKADTMNRAIEITRQYRSRNIPTVWGGIHPTVCPEDCLPHADAIVIGEAELLWERILADLAQGNLKRVYQQNAPIELSHSPIPRWELIQGKNYLYTNTLCMGRGCPYRCEFCYNSSRNIPCGHRMKPYHQIVREIESLNCRQVMFIDDNFIGSPERTKEFLKNHLPAGLTWHTAVSTDIGQHEDILDLMAQTGCKSLFIGFETLNERNLVASNKHQNRIAEYSRTISRIHQRGIMVNASLVFGFDDDDTSVFDTTLKWLTQMKIETMTSHILTPYPGTQLYRKLLAENRIIDFNLEHYNTAHVVFTPKRMTIKELLNGYHHIYSEFYSLNRILQRIPDSPSQWVGYLMFNFLYRKYGKFFARLGTSASMRALANLALHLAYPNKRKQQPETQVSSETCQTISCKLP